MSRLDVLLLLDARAAAVVLAVAAAIEPAPPVLAARARQMFRIETPTTWRGVLWCIGNGLEERECPEA